MALGDEHTLTLSPSFPSLPPDSIHRYAETFIDKLVNWDFVEKQLPK